MQVDLLAMEARDRVEPVREAGTDALLDLRGVVDRLVDNLTAGAPPR